MKRALSIVVLAAFFSSCGTTRQSSVSSDSDYGRSDTSITQSLFNDKGSSISEDNIQRILEGHYSLPSSLRVGIIRLNNDAKPRWYVSDEENLKSQQAYLEVFENKFKQSPGVQRVTTIPDMMVSKSPGFTVIREAAVRMQSDVVLIYSINSDIYSKYKMFKSPDIKAYATVQLVLMDVRTGLIPFSAVVTRDVLSKKKEGDLDVAESMGRTQKEAVMAAIEEAGGRIVAFLQKK